MKIWQIRWNDKTGKTRIRYRSSLGDARVRRSRANSDGANAYVKMIEVPQSRFGLIDFLNNEMASLEGDE